MKLEEALKYFRKGKSIRRSAWEKGSCIDPYNYFRNMHGAYLEFEGLMGDDWEIFDGPTINWKIVLNNSCLCFFWNDALKDSIKLSTLRVLGGIKNYPFTDADGINWKHCRPVSKDELIFYEDIENER